jgi:hypothetical protein
MAAAAATAAWRAIGRKPWRHQRVAISIEKLMAAAWRRQAARRSGGGIIVGKPRNGSAAAKSGGISVAA